MKNKILSSLALSFIGAWLSAAPLTAQQRFYIAPIVGIAALRGDALHGLGYQSEDVHVNLSFAGVSAGYRILPWLALDSSFLKTGTGSQELERARPNSSGGQTAVLESSGKYSFRLSSEKANMRISHKVCDRWIVNLWLGAVRNRLDVHHIDYPLNSVVPIPSGTSSFGFGDRRVTRTFSRSSSFGGAGVGLVMTKRLTGTVSYDYCPRIEFKGPYDLTTRTAVHGFNMALEFGF